MEAPQRAGSPREGGLVEAQSEGYVWNSRVWLAVRRHALFVFDKATSEGVPTDCFLLDERCTIKESGTSSLKISRENGPHTLYFGFASAGVRRDFKERLNGAIVRGMVPLKIDPKAQGSVIPAAAIRVCSYNINFGTYDEGYSTQGADEIAAAAAKQQPDAVFWQETHDAWERYLTQRFMDPMPYALFHNDGAWAGGIGFVSKYPTQEVALMPSPVNWFPGHLCIMQTPVGNVQVLNLHLRPPLNKSALPTPAAYYGSKEDRVMECKFYSKWIDWSMPVVVCGDFNEEPGSPSVSFWMKNFGMRAALADFDPNTTTWWWILPGGFRPTARFDYIFYHGLSCSAARVLQEGCSDHYPIVAQLHALPPVAPR